MARPKDTEAYKASRRARYAIARSLGYSSNEAKRLESLSDRQLVREVQSSPTAPQTVEELSMIREAYTYSEGQVRNVPELAYETSRYRSRWFFQRLVEGGYMENEEVLGLYMKASSEGFVMTRNSSGRALAVLLDLDPYDVTDFHIGITNAE